MILNKVRLSLIAALSFISFACAQEQDTVGQGQTAPRPDQDSVRPQVIIDTNFGEMQAELFSDLAPITVDNFLAYIDEGFFDQLIFHRVIANFMIQGGGFNAQMEQKRPSRDPIINEAEHSAKNSRGTLSMARTNDPHSATSQFFINLVDNAFLDYGRNNPGYAVFGQLLSGFEVLDAISAEPTTTRRGHHDVPEQPIIINSIRLLEAEQPEEPEPNP